MADPTITPPSVDSTTPAPAPTGVSGMENAPVTQAPTTPGGATAMQGASDFAAAQGFENQAQNATQKINDLASKPVIPPDAPHAKLLSMVSALATGLSAFGTSLATHGKEGGAKEVAQVLGEQQRQQMAEKQFAVEQRNQQIQQLVTVAQTNHTQAQNIWLAAKLPLELETEMLNVQKGAQELQAGNIAQVGAKAEARQKSFEAAASGASDIASYWADRKALGDDVDAEKNAAGPQGVPPAMAARWTNAVTAAGNYANDAAIKDQVAKVKDSNANPTERALAAQQIANYTAAKQQAVNVNNAAIKSQQEQASQDAYMKNVPKGADGQPTQDFATWQAAQTESAREAVQEGDPVLLGDQLAENLVAPSEVISSRAMSKPFYERVLQEANKRSQELYGRPYNMAAAEEQFNFVKEFNNPNSKTQASITSANTFFNHAADLDKLAKRLQTTNVPLLNTPLNQLEGKFGAQDITQLRAAVQPVIQEYQNALAAGFAPTAEDQQAAATIMNTGASAAQINIAATQMAHTLLRRLDSTDQMYYTHTGVHYPNMITPDGRDAVGTLGLDTGRMQTGGTFGSSPQPLNPGASSSTSGKGVSLAAARQLPAMKGKSDDEIRALIQAQGHSVLP